MKVTLKKKNIHSKQLFDIIHQNVIDSLDLLDALTDIDEICILIEMLVIDYEEDYKLEQINVIGDARNNTYTDVKNGRFIIDVYYKHVHCFNTTRLTYTLIR